MEISFLKKILKKGRQELSQAGPNGPALESVQRPMPPPALKPSPEVASSPTPKSASPEKNIKQKVEELLLKMSSAGADTRESLLKEIVLLGTPAIEPLINYLRYGEKGIRLMAAIALGKNRDLLAVPPLGHAAKDRDPDVAAAAKASMQELQGNRLAVEAESARKRKAEDLEKILQDIKKTDTWRLQFEYLLCLSRPDPDPRKVEEQRAGEAELAARGVMILPAESRSPEAVGAVWKDLFTRAKDYNDYELRQFAAGLVEHVPAAEAEQMLLKRFGKVYLNDNAAHALAVSLAKIGSSEARAGLRKWIEKDRPRLIIAADITRFVYGDVRPLVENLGRKQDYAVLAALFNSTDHSVPFQLGSRKEVARETLLKAGRDAVPSILKTMNPDEAGLDDLARLLVEIGDREAIPELKRYLDAGRFAASFETTARIFKFVYGDRPVKEFVSTILKEAGTDAERREKIEVIIRASGWLGRGTSVLYCDCGWPTRIRYSDGSTGPINPALDSESMELYTAKYFCPQCHKHVATVTT